MNNLVKHAEPPYSFHAFPEQNRIRKDWRRTLNMELAIALVIVTGLVIWLVNKKVADPDQKFNNVEIDVIKTNASFLQKDVENLANTITLLNDRLTKLEQIEQVRAGFKKS